MLKRLFPVKDPLSISHIAVSVAMNLVGVFACSLIFPYNIIKRLVISTEIALFSARYELNLHTHDLHHVASQPVLLQRKLESAGTYRGSSGAQDSDRRKW